MLWDWYLFNSAVLLTTKHVISNDVPTTIYACNFIHILYTAFCNMYFTLFITYLMVRYLDFIVEVSLVVVIIVLCEYLYIYTNQPHLKSTNRDNNCFSFYLAVIL